MFAFLEGRIVEKTIDSIVMNVNNVGYLVNVAHSDDFELNEFSKVYVYLQVRDDGLTLYGFKYKEEKDLFLKLINVSGIGPKTAIGMFFNSNAKSIIQAIETSNTSYLKKLPGIGPKAAQQIIVDLKGKLVFDELNNETKGDKMSQELLDTRDALKALGFKVSAIDPIIADLGKEKHDVNEYLRLALARLRKQ